MSRVQNAVSLVIEQVEHARATRRDEGDEGDDEDDEDDEDDAREVREDGRNEGTVATRTRGVKRARDAMGAATMEEVRRQEYVPMPSPTEEESHGIPSDHTAASVLQRCLDLLRESRELGVKPQTVGNYGTCWRKWLRWAWEDWKVHGSEYTGYSPYCLTSARVERFVIEAMRTAPSTQRGEFGIGTMNTVKNAMSKLSRLAVLLDDDARRSMCGAVVDPGELERRELAWSRWRLCSNANLQDQICRMGVWKLAKRDVLDAHKAFAKGGVGRSKFNAPDALGRCLEDLELHCLAEWTAAARLTDAGTHRKYAWLRLKVLAPECFLARPAEITRLRLPQIKVSEYSGCLGAHARLWKLELPASKGSQDTTYPLSRFALRHRDVACCAVSALAEALYASFHVDALPRTLYPLAKVSSHAFANSSSCPREDKAVYLAQDDCALKSWHLEHVLSSKRCPKEPMSEKETREVLRSMRRMERQSTQGITEAFSVKLLHRRSIAVTKATALGASEADLRSLGNWNAADSLRDAYLHGAPPVNALMAVAGCDARTGLYYTDFDRDRLPVPDSLARRLWSWVEEWEETSQRLRDHAVAGVDHKLDTFLKALRELRVVFYQDMAFIRAMELESNAGVLRRVWSFWDTHAFSASGKSVPEWLALVEEARERIRSGPRMPARLKFDTDFVARDVVASLASHSREVGDLKATLAALQREQREHREHSATLESKLEQLTQLISSGSLTGAGAAMQGSQGSTKDQPRAEWGPLFTAVQPQRLDEDVVKAADAWRTARSFTFTEKTPSTFKDARYRYDAFYRSLETYASARDEPREVALRRLEATRLKLDKQTLATLHAVFFKELKKAREDEKASPGPAKARAANKFILSFASRLNELVDGISQEL